MIRLLYTFQEIVTQQKLSVVKSSRDGGLAPAELSPGYLPTTPLAQLFYLDGNIQKIQVHSCWESP